MKKYGPVQRICLGAMLLVMNVLLTRLPGYFQLGPLFSFNRISLGPAVTIFASLLLGPISGAIVGAGGDALGWLLLGQQTGAFNFYLTIAYAVFGILPYFLAKLFKEERFRPWMLFSFLGALVLVLILLLFFSSSLDERFSSWGWNLLISKSIISAVIVFLAAGLILGLIFTERFFKKKDWEGKEPISSYRYALISIVVKLWMIFIKPLCFELYCRTFLGEGLSAWGVSYGVLVFLSAIFAFANVFLNTFFLTWIHYFSRHFISRSQNV